MKTPTNFTFKSERPTGRYRSFFSTTHLIKLNKQVVGHITDKVPHQIRLKVVKEDIMEDKNPNCDWKWVTLKKSFETIDEAKEFLNNPINFDAINKLNLSC